MTKRRLNRIKQQLAESKLHYQRILTNDLVEKGLSESGAKHGAKLIVDAGRFPQDDSLQRSANTYRLMLGMETRFGA